MLKKKTTLALAIVSLGALALLAVGCPTPPAGPAITVTTAALPSGFRGAVYAPAALQASGGAPADYAWSIVSGALPDGLVLSAAGEVSGTPTAAGAFAFTAQVTDGASTPGSKALTLVVDAIAVSPDSLPAARNGAAYSQTISASGGTAPYAFTVSAGDLPAGLTLDGASGVLSGTPSAFGTSGFTVLVTDAAGAYNDRQYSLPVNSGVAVTVETASCPNGFTAGAYAAALAAAGGQGSYTWSIASGSLPAGIALDPSTGALSGTAGEPGSAVFTVRATDTVETANYGEKQFTVIIRSAAAVTTASVPRGAAGAAYSAALAASGGSGAYTWSVSSGALPAGLSLDASSGVISGTPSVTGTVAVTVRAADNESPANFDDQALSIVLDAHVAVTTASLPGIGANKAYSRTLAATGGQGSYTWSISSGSLPLDMTLGASTGTINGYPSRPGAYNFTVACADSANSANSATAALSLTVTDLEWTLMVYLDGDNNLETNAFTDFNEMEYSDLRGTGVKVIVLLDGISGYYTGTGAFTDTRLFEVSYDSAGAWTSTGIVSRELASTELGLTTTGAEELNMGDPNVLSHFIDCCKTSFTATNYSLILWDHGSGWRNGSMSTRAKRPAAFRTLENNPLTPSALPPKTPVFRPGYKAVCADDTSIDILYTQEIGTAIAGKGIGTVCLDLCLSGMLEIMYEVRNHASYLIGSEDLVPGYGYAYDEVLNTFKAGGRTVSDWHAAVVNAYQDQYYYESYTTISVIDLSRINTVMTAFNAFSDALYAACATDDVRNEVANLIYGGVQPFLGLAFPCDLNLDLYDMASVISAETDYADAEAAALMAAVDNAVTLEWHNASGDPLARGIAVHFIPLDADGYPASHLAAYDRAYTGSYPLSFTANSTWCPNTAVPNGLLWRIFYELLP